MRSRRYTGKYAAQKRAGGYLAAVLVLVAVLSASTGAVVAYLSTTTGAVQNTFTAAQDPVPDVTEDAFTQGVSETKRNVKVKLADQGEDKNYAVYVRAAIVITWQNEHGNVLSRTPSPGTDYTITINNTDWFLHSDGFYYHKAPVATGSETAVLISECSALLAAPANGYTLNVDIISQTVQAVGTTDQGGIPAVTSAWKVNIGSDGNLTN